MSTSMADARTDLERSVSPENLRNTIDGNPSLQMLDVRTGAEFESARIPNSVNVPLDRLGDYAQKIASIRQPLVLVCRSGARAEQAHATLAAAGATDVAVLTGGIDAWQSSGGDVEVGGREVWALDRQVRLVAGSLTLAGIGASIVAPRAKWLAGFIGGGLTFSALSNTCAMGNVLARLPYNQTATHDVDDAVRRLTSAGVAGGS